MRGERFAGYESADRLQRVQVFRASEERQRSCSFGTAYGSAEHGIRLAALLVGICFVGIARNEIVELHQRRVSRIIGKEDGFKVLVHYTRPEERAVDGVAV